MSLDLKGVMDSIAEAFNKVYRGGEIQCTVPHRGTCLIEFTPLCPRPKQSGPCGACREFIPKRWKEHLFIPFKCEWWN